MHLIANDAYASDPYQDNSHSDQWQKLKQFTDARIAIGRVGCSIPTSAMLEFQLAHAQAKDAVYQELDRQMMQQQLSDIQLQSLVIHSRADTKEQYLKRPDLGRLLNKESKQLLQNHVTTHPKSYDLCIVVADGLSALAITENAVPFISSLKDYIQQENWTIAPIVIAQGSRVALGDPIAEIFNADMLVILIGERPGLSSPDSMGIYYTWQAKSGYQDSKRNCISNIRAAGLTIEIATQRLISLMRNSKKLGLSGVKLKDQHQLQSVQQKHSIKKLF